MSDTLNETEIMTRMRNIGISDADIARVMGYNSRQVINFKLGPRKAKASDPLANPLELPPPETFPEFLIAYRERHRLSQIQLTRLLGIKRNDPGTISSWENRRHTCDHPTPIMGYLAFIENYNLTE